MDLKKLKSPENCFFEIISYIKNNNVHMKDDNSFINKNVMNYSKLRNYSDKDYVYTNEIKLDEKYNLFFYFSNKRSYISINLNNEYLLENFIEIYEKNYIFIQYILLIYSEKLFKKYNIDEFICNLA